MKLTHGLHLAYCTNVHRGGDWAETLASLEQHTLAVRRRVAPGRPYAIGLRLSDTASSIQKIIKQRRSTIHNLSPEESETIDDIVWNLKTNELIVIKPAD